MDKYLSYFHISWLSETDGPGKRVALFLQGCHLDCSWCHSPHSQPAESPILYFDGLCKKCGRCQATCPNNVHLISGNGHTLKRENCTHCGACVDACPQSSQLKHSGALILPTTKMEVSKLFEMVKPQLELLGNGGGITFSGGEPLLQAEPLAALAKMCKESGIHTALETSGIVPSKHIQAVHPFIDTWLVGLRLVTSKKNEQAEYLKNKTLETLNYLTQQADVDIIVRIPVIPAITTTEAYLDGVYELLQRYGIKKVELLPHNPESSHYYKAMGQSPMVDYDKNQAEKMFQHVSHYLNY